MSNTVTIIAVSLSGATGLAGVLAGVYNGAVGRRWDAREERTAELRHVLDGVARSMGIALDCLDDAHQALKLALTDDAGEAYQRAQAVAAQTAEAASRVSVRIGSKAPVSKAVDDASETILDLYNEVVERLTSMQLASAGESEKDSPEYEEHSKLRSAASDAMHAFYDAAAAELGLSGLQRRRGIAARLRRSGAVPPEKRSTSADNTQP